VTAFPRAKGFPAHMLSLFDAQHLRARLPAYTGHVNSSSPSAAGMRPPDQMLENVLGSGLCMALEPHTQTQGPISPRIPNCILPP
jgi:hypothetical protein